MRHYKILLIGLGSIGTRHLINIAQVLQERGIPFSVDLVRTSHRKNLGDVKNLVNNVYYDFKEVPSDYDIAFVTNPTHLHFETIRQCVDKSRHMFIEKPVFDHPYYSIRDLKLRDDGIYYVACPLRYTSVIQHIKRSIDLSRVFSVRVICSSYLPDWRPGVDYRTTYSAHSDQGGGVSIDLIHEWDYVQYLFGPPQRVYNIRGKVSDLQIDSDDLSVYIAQCERHIIEVHLDYFGRKSIREIKLFTDEDTIVGDIVSSEVRYLQSGKTVSFRESRNDFQQKEIRYFFDIIEGRANNHNDIIAATKTLKIAKEGSL